MTSSPPSPIGTLRRRTERSRVMSNRGSSRRAFLAKTAAGLAAVALPLPAFAQGGGRVVVIGGGFAGATCARWLRRIDPGLTVTLVEANRTFTACPFSNGVLAGLRQLKDQQFGYDGLSRE